MVRQEVPMGDQMPYLVEKGGTFRLLEEYLNTGQPERRAFLEIVRNSCRADNLAGQLDWFVQGPPGLWNDPAFAQKPVPEGAPAWTGPQERDLLIEKWFGFVTDDSGNWVQHMSALRSMGSPSTTGFWIAYEGDVHKIVCAAVRWALELSLGLGPDDNDDGRDDPWPIELFWKCLAPWFEAWVLQRPTNGSDTGLVSVILVTPTHDGANVAESPIATSATVLSDGGGGVPSTGRDYEVLAVDGTPGNAGAGAAPPAPDRTYAMWVVTHRNQIKSGSVTVVDNNAAPSDLADWGIAQLACYQGNGDIVVVSPSMAAGGIKHDGSV
jgi:hypothetical protein